MAVSVFGPETQKGATAPKQAVQPGFVDPSGKLQAGQVDGSGNLKVAVTGAGSGGTSSVDGAAFVADTTAGTPAMGAYEATPSTLSDNEVGVVGLTADRAMKVAIVSGGGSGGTSSDFGDPFPSAGTAIGIADPDGNMHALSAETFDYDSGAGTVAQTGLGVVIPASGGPLPVLGGHGTAAQALRVELPTDGTGVVNVGSSALPSGAATAGNQGTANLLLLSIDSEASAGWINQGILLGPVNETAPATDTASSGLNGRLQRVAQRISSLITALGSPFQAGGSIGNTSFGATQATASSLNATVVGTGTFVTQATSTGNVADGSAASGNPVMVGAIAKSPDGTTPGSVAEDQVGRLSSDLNRRQYVNARSAFTWSYHSDGSSALTDDSVQGAPGSGLQIVITEIIFSTGAATACNIFFEESTTKILGPWYLEAVAGRGVMWRGEKKVTANTAVTVTTSASIAQALDIQGYIQAV